MNLHLLGFVPRRKKSIENWGKVSFGQFGKQGVVIYMVKSLTDIEETTIDRRTMMHIPGDHVLYEPSAKGGR